MRKKESFVFGLLNGIAFFFLICNLQFITCNLFAQQTYPAYTWAKSIGGANNDHGYDVAVDNTGNVLITGNFRDTVDFDPGPGVVNLTSVGGSDIFFAKYDSAGNYIWAKSIGSIDSDISLSIDTDNEGNVYITGYYSGTADFDPDPGVANLTNYGAFFAKYDSTGNYLWAKSIWGNASAYNIAVDNAGDVYITGLFYDTADFDPGPGVANLTSIGLQDIFFAKYDAAGNYLWAKNIGGTSNDWGKSIAVDTMGNTYITGYYSGTADFDPGPGVANLTSIGLQDIFFAKYDAAGNYLWAKNIGSKGEDAGKSIVVDNTGNVYITGYFSDTADFDPGADTAILTRSGTAWQDVFFAKYDTSGNYLWAKSIGSKGGDYGNSIAVDNTGNVYITGYYQDTVDFDPGPGVANLSATGGYNTFYAKYDTAGNYLWAASHISTSYNAGNTIAVDIYGNVYITGELGGIADFDPGPGVVNLSSGGNYDIFFAKYRQCNILSTISVTNPTCNGSCNGTATASVSGGMGAYTYSWNDSSSQTTATVTSLCAGNFTVKISDTNGCQINDSALVMQPAAISLTVGSDSATFGVNNGKAYVAVSGGTPSYNYLWDDPNTQTTDTASNLLAGSYNVLVTDNNGCTDSISITVSNITGITKNAFENSLKIYPNPTNATFIILLNNPITQSPNNLIIIYNTLGEIVYQSAIKARKSEIDLSGHTNGIYFLQIRTDQGVARKKIVLNK